MTPVGQADTDSWQQVGLNSSRPKSSGPIKKGRTCKMARHDKLYRWMRYLMLLLCVILVISGFVLLGLGAWIRYGAATFVDVLGPYSSQLIYISYICIGMGSVLSFTGLIGCCGAWKENRFFIMLFFFIVTMLFVAEIIGTIFVLTYRNLVSLVVRDASKNSLMTVYMGPAATDPISTAWNTVMVKFKCCGFENSTVDFKGSVFSTTTGLNYPKTCCVNKTLADCDGITITPSLIQPQSCFGKVITVIREQSVILGSAAGCICMMELSSMILAMVLFVKLGLMRHPW
ncbi:tetraspanin-16-like isoform X1 [Oncorhynchus keta]|uniref:tetraspanin-16-like isoform X1 n=1 Tax=Oncorhynchus keta TaxID=8018 RepID=UPI0015FE4892|nr:tetraspanin-16-like isoform X1 [Oncorhynchus keta]